MLYFRHSLYISYNVHSKHGLFCMCAYLADISGPLQFFMRAYGSLITFSSAKNIVITQMHIYDLELY